MFESHPVNDMPVPERRRSVRYPCGFNIAIEWGAAVLSGAGNQISDEGMFVEMDSPLWVGAQFAAQLALDEPVTLDCVVCRVEPRRGMALTYTASQENSRAAVSSLLKRLAAS